MRQTVIFFSFKRSNQKVWLLETGINTSKRLWLHCVKEEKSWRWFDIRHSSWVWLKSRKKDFYVLFTNGYRTPGNAGSWKVDWQRKLFLGPDLRQNKNPLADLVLVLLVFLVLLFSALAAATVALRRRRTTRAALPPQPAVNSHQRNPLFQSTSLTISAFARLSELKGLQVGHPNPHQILAAVQVKSSPSRHCLLFPPFRFLVLPKAPPCYWWQRVK